MNPLNSEPVISVAVITPIIVFLLARFAVDVDTETATAIATAVLVIGGWFARSRVSPVDKA